MHLCEMVVFMMKFKKVFIILITISLSCIIFCFIQFYSDVNIKLVNTNWWIKHHRYKKDHEIVYAVTETKHTIEFEQYLLKEEATTEIVINKNTNFILSFHSNAIMLYKWHITNELRKDSVQYLNDEYIEPVNYFETFMAVVHPEKGENWRRINYYFKNINGNEIINFENSNSNEKLRNGNKSKAKIYNYKIRILSN